MEHNTHNISVKDFLARQNIHPTVQRNGYGMYLSPFRTESEPSFKVDYNRNLWYDFGVGRGGSIIDFVMVLDGCNFKHAVKRLNNELSSFSFHCHEIDKLPYPRCPAMKINEIRLLQDIRLIEYLESRQINIEIAKSYCKQIHYQLNDKEYYAIGFKSDEGGWELRNKYYKGCILSKGITSISVGSPICCIFEGFMDMLAYLTINNLPIAPVDILVLNSVNNLSKSQSFFEKYQRIHCYLDNDDAGRRSINILKNMVTNLIDESHRYHGYKDFNEYLISIKNK